LQIDPLRGSVRGKEIHMKLSRAFLVSGVALGLAGAVHAHHSFAQFDSTRFVLIEGRVTDWSFASPHAWLHVEAPDEKGVLQKWSFEGGAPIRLARQNVTGNTYRNGEKVRVVMSPLRDGRRAGAMCFIVKEDGAITMPNDGTCEPAKVIEQWKTRGWLEQGKHLDGHPAD
jgi:hypothetical protein